VADGDRLIICHYRNVDEECAEVPALLDRLGYVVTGEAEAAGVSVAWCERGR